MYVRIENSIFEQKGKVFLVFYELRQYFLHVEFFLYFKMHYLLHDFLDSLSHLLLFSCGSGYLAIKSKMTAIFISQTTKSRPCFKCVRDH